MSDGKIEDHFVSDIEYVLTKYLKSETSFGPLLDYDFPIVDGKKILEINIKSSAKPVFYKHLSSNNREKQFQIFYNNEKQFERILDDFYYREGSHKEPITTFEEFLRYSNEHFRKFKA